jgi:D-alanine--D-alanine ligase
MRAMTTQPAHALASESKAPLRVIFLFGGRSSEHEISLRSAEQVLGAINPQRIEAIRVGMSRDGFMRLGAAGQTLAEVVALGEAVSDLRTLGADLVFPVLHGPFGEDGRVQGMLEMMGLPYVGSGVLGSALCMDKIMQKQVIAASAPDIPQVRWCSVDLSHESVAAAIERARALRYPVFVKPANLGSSVGIQKVPGPEALEAAVAFAGQFDTRVIIEQGEDVREIELAVLGDGGPDTLVSMPGEIELPPGVWYDYSVKYEQDVAITRVPAHGLPAPVVVSLQAHALKAFRATGCHGLARIDFFVHRQNGQVWLNELNTLPGFTTISMYPKLMAHAGVPYGELIERLSRLALLRHEQQQGLRSDKGAVGA